MAVKIAPRVLVYAADSAPPPVLEDWLALPQVHDSEVFGDGSHPTTRLCAGVVDLLCRQRQPSAVLDVGTGTGILARIARARRALFVVGTDIDPNALRVARKNCELDQHPVAIHLADHSRDAWGPRFDLVVANILAEPLTVLAPALTWALKPQGVLLLSGFTRLQTPALRRVYESLQLPFVREAHLDEWALLMFERPR